MSQSEGVVTSESGRLRKQLRRARSDDFVSWDSLEFVEDEEDEGRDTDAGTVGRVSTKWRRSQADQQTEEQELDEPAAAAPVPARAAAASELARTASETAAPAAKKAKLAFSTDQLELEVAEAVGLDAHALTEEEDVLFSSKRPFNEQSYIKVRAPVAAAAAASTAAAAAATAAAACNAAGRCHCRQRHAFASSPLPASSS